MANPYKTGRVRTITYEGSFSLPVGGKFVAIVPAGDPASAIRTFGDISFHWNGLSCGLTDAHAAIYFGQFPPWSAGFKIYASTGEDSDDETFYWERVGLPTVGTTDFMASLSGTYSMSIDVEEWCEIYSVPGNSYGFPSYGGPAQSDGIPGTGAKFYERARPGGSYQVSLSIEGTRPQGDLSGGVSASTPITESNAIVVSYGMSVSAEAHGYAHFYPPAGPMQGSCLINASIKWNGSAISLNIPEYAYSVDYPNGDLASRVDHTGGFCIETAVNADEMRKLPTTEMHTTSSALFSPPVGYRYQGRLRALNRPYPGSIATLVRQKPGAPQRVIGPNPATSWSQRYYSASAVLDVFTIPPSVSVDERVPYAAWLDQDLLKSEGEDPRDWRIQARGISFPSFSMVQAPSQTMDDGTSASGWAGTSGATITLTGTAVRVTAGAVPGGATRTFGTPFNSEGYRYLRVRLRSRDSANRLIAVTINGKSWTIMTGGINGYVDRDIDLCCPMNLGTVIDSTDSRWPVSGPPVPPPSPESDGALSGISRIGQIQFDGVPASEAIDIDSITLVRVSHAKATFLPAFLSWHSGWLSPTDSTDVKPFLILESDGKLVADWLDVAHVMPYASPDYYRFYSLSDLCVNINSIPGWTATEETVFPSDGYHKNTLYSHLAFGAGALYDWSNATWTEGFDRDATGVIQVRAQDLFDEVIGYPGVGNPWGTSAYPPSYLDQSLPVVTSKAIRGQSYGLVFKNDHTPYAKLGVIAVSDKGVLAGATVAKTLGDYATGLPYGRGNRVHSTMIIVPPSSAIAYGATWQTESFSEYRFW